MGSSSDKVKVVIIDQRKDQHDFFDPIRNHPQIQSIYYDGYDKFLQQQSLKKLSYIIIREQQKAEQQNYKYSNLLERKKAENIQYLRSEFQDNVKKPSITLRERLITYIRKYSLQKLVIYLVVKDILNYKIPDSEAPYITLAAQKIQHIIQHVKHKPKRQEPSIFKFKRLVKDQYRRIMLCVIQVDKVGSAESLAKWKRITEDNKTQASFFSTIQDFEQSLISNYNDYIILTNQMVLSYVLDIKKIYKFESKLIYYGKSEELTEQKRNQLWMISQGRDQSDQIQHSKNIKDKSIKSFRQFIIKTIKNCSYFISDQVSVQPDQIVLYLFNTYDQENKMFIQKSLKQGLKLKYNKESQRKWLQTMKIYLVQSIDELRKVVTYSVYTYLITFDEQNDKIQELKQHIKSCRLQNRIYLYNCIPKKQEIALLKQKNAKESVKKVLQGVISTTINKAKFKIKFQIAPPQSLVLYDMNPRQVKYFSTKLWLLCISLNKQVFITNYCSEKKMQIVQGYHILCNCQKFLTQLLPILQQEIASDQKSYFKDLKVIIFDQKDVLKRNWLKLQQNTFIAFIHFNAAIIQDFLDILFVKQLNISIFMKKSLPKYLQALKEVEDSKCRNIKFTGLIVSKNDLLKDVFGDENFKISTEYQLSFMHLSIGNRQADDDIQIFQNFIKSYSKLWRIGYNIVTDQQDNKNVFAALKEDIIKCLHKCKYYSLIQITDDEFQYFYIKRLDSCENFIDLQITLIFILSLPHGFNKNLDQIFMNPRQNIMISKVFSPYIVALFTSFCSLEDEVMSKENLVVYLQEGNLANKMIGIQPGDIIFNNGFVLCGRNENELQSKSNHCFFIQFENIPMLSRSYIKNYLLIERFSFYKESTQYIIAPYTKFKVKSKNITAEGKYQIYLVAINHEQDGFISNIFKYNNINESSLVNMIKKDIGQMTSQNNKNHYQKILDQANSLYKKAQIISLYEQKQEMIKSIKDSFDYKKFLNCMKASKYMSAFNYIDLKSKKRKQTTEFQAVYYKKMLGVQKSYIFYKLSQYKMAIKELQRVLGYLKNQICQDEEDWLIKKLQYFKNNIHQTSIKRNKLLNKMQKTKHWKIYAEQQFPSKNSKASKVVVKMQQVNYQWNSKYLQSQQQFYLQKKGSQQIYKGFKLNSDYGQAITNLHQTDKYIKTTLKQQIKSIIINDNIDSILFKAPQPKIQKVLRKEEQKLKASPMIKQNKQKLKVVTKEQPNILDTIFKKEVVIQIKSEKEIIQPNNQMKQQTQQGREVKNQMMQRGVNNWMKQQQKEVNNEDSKVSIYNIVESQNSLVQRAFNITQKVQWQAFYYVDKFLLTKKGKHYKGKILNKLK